MLFAFFFLITSCGGGGSSSTTATTTVAATTTAATATATEASVFGTADKISVATAKPTKKAGTVKTASPLSGAAVTAIKSDGTSAGTTTTATDGTYTLLLPKSATYVIKITSGNVVMKSVYTVGTADATINVNPGTTAAVVILEQKLGATFDSGTAFSTAVSGVDVNASVTAVAATAEFTTTANAVVAAVAANTNPLTDTAVTSAATTAAASVSVASLVGIWVAGSSGDSWTFTATTATLSGSNCVESGTYTTSGNNLTFTVTAQSPAGCKNDTVITGTYSISGNTLTVVVTSGAGGTFTGTKLSSTSTIVRYRTDAPWVAYQVGTGPWTAATSTDTAAVKTYTFDVGSPTAKFGVASVCSYTRIWQFTRAEAWDRTQICDSYQITVAGTVTGLTGGNAAIVYIGGKWGMGIANGGAFSIGVPLTGIYDVVAVEYDSLTYPYGPFKMLIQRDVVIGSATSGIALDFANGVAMVSRSVTVTGPTVNTKVYASIEVHTKNGTWVDLTPGANANGSGSPISLFFPPASAMVAGEVFQLAGYYDYYDVGTLVWGPITAVKFLDATVDPGNTTTLDPSTVTPISGVTVSAGTHPTISGLSYAKAASSPTLNDFWLALSGDGGAVALELSTGWLGTATTYTVPDFTGVGTWDPAWNLATGTTGFEVDAEMDSNGFLSWTTGGNDSPGDTGAAASMTSTVTLKPTLYGPKSPIRRD